MINEWIMCPNCDGKGTKELNAECRSCEGKGIINQATGLPPVGTHTYIPIVIDRPIHIDPYRNPYPYYSYRHYPNEEWVPPWHPSKQPYCNPYPIVTSAEPR